MIRAGEKGTIEEQLANTRRTGKAIVEVMKLGYEIVVTHGNGPQVGAALLRSERALDQVYGHTLDVCVSTTQGEIGYFLEQALQHEIAGAGFHHPVATLLTQVIVDPDDAAFRNPTKPIGPFYSRETAEEKKRLFGWEIVEDAARGYRRVVPSPEPIEVVEEETVRLLLESGVLVIALGGGGIPVVRANDGVRGVEAVIDKDRASALLAARLGVDMFVISTDTDYVYIDYRKESQRKLERVTVGEVEAYLKQGQFPPGNMGPKIESAIHFLRSGGREVVITSYQYLSAAMRGKAGTRIVPS